MTLSDWIPAVSTSTAISILGFAAGTYYKAKIETGLQQKLAQLNSRLRADEEALKAELRSRDEQIAALRAGALSGMAARQASLDKRRLEALERLWADAIATKHSFKMLLSMTASIKMDYAIEKAAKQDIEGAKIRQFAEIIWQSAGLDNLKRAEPAEKERLFAPPIVWALFSLYTQLFTFAYVQFAAMKAGIGKDVIADSKPMLEAVKSALPHYSSFIDEHGAVALPHIIDDLEQKLFSEVVASFDSTSSDEKTVEQAAKILKAVDTITAPSLPVIEVPDIPGLKRT